MDYFNRKGEPIDLITYGLLHRDQEYVIIRKTIYINAKVSTVWLGINHNFDPNGTPLIFESMIFGGEHTEYQDRYETEEQAIAGHQRIITAIENGEDPDDER